MPRRLLLPSIPRPSRRPGGALAFDTFGAVLHPFVPGSRTERAADAFASRAPLLWTPSIHYRLQSGHAELTGIFPDSNARRCTWRGTRAAATAVGCDEERMVSESRVRGRKSDVMRPRTTDGRALEGGQARSCSNRGASELGAGEREVPTCHVLLIRTNKRVVARAKPEWPSGRRGTHQRGGSRVHNALNEGNAVAPKAPPCRPADAPSSLPRPGL